MSNGFGSLFKSPVEGACDAFDSNYRKYSNLSLAPDEREKARKEALAQIQILKNFQDKAKRGGAPWLDNVPLLKLRAEDVLKKEIKLMKPALVEAKPLSPSPFEIPKPAEAQTPLRPPTLEEIKSAGKTTGKKAKKKIEKPAEKPKPAEQKLPSSEAKAALEKVNRALKEVDLGMKISELKHLDDRYYISPVSYMRAKFKPDDGQLKDLAHAGVHLKKGEKYSRLEIREAIGKELQKAEKELKALTPAEAKKERVITDARQLAGYDKYEYLLKKAREEAKNAPPKKRVITDARQLAGYEKYEYLQKQAQEKKAAELKQKPVKTEKKPEEKIHAGYERYEHLLEEARKKKAKEEGKK